MRIDSRFHGILLLILFVCATTNISAASACNVSTACALCMHETGCAFLYRHDECEGVADTLDFFNETLPANDPRRLFYPDTWVNGTQSVIDACAALSSDVDDPPGLPEMIVLDALIRMRVFYTTPGLGCTDPNERMIWSPDDRFFYCRCAPGHVCSTDRVDVVTILLVIVIGLGMAAFMVGLAVMLSSVWKLSILRDDNKYV